MRTVSWSATFLLILVSLGIAGCGVSVPGVSSKSSTAGLLSASSSSLSFGSVSVGNTAAETLTVTNTGTAAIQLSQAQVTGKYFSLTGATTPLTLAAGSSLTLTVNFWPQAAGAAAGTLALTTPDSTTSIGLTGTGTAAAVPGLTLSSTSLAFGTVTLNTAATQSVTLTSSGTAPVTISAATLTGSGFSMSSLGLPLTLSPGQTASLTLTFDPGNAGSFSGALTLATNTSDGSATIQMAGTGVTIQSLLNDFSCDSDNVAGQGTENCAITLDSPAGTGGLTVGLASSSTSVLVPSQLMVAEGTSSGSFSVSYFPVANAQTVTLTATTTNSHKQHNLNLGSSSSPGVKLNPNSVSFGNVMLNSTATQPVTVTSSGTTALTISAATVTGTGYGLSGMALPLTLNPGQTANLTVSFNPSAAGSVTGAVTLTTNAATANIALSGTGQAAATLSTVSCASSSMTSAGSDACTVSLTSAAPSGGLAVALSSNSSAVAVPASVVVPAGATSVGFTASVSSVTTAQTATLTAQSGGVTATYAISLGGTVPGLTLGSTNLSFGNVTLNSPTSQSVLLKSSGTAPLTISAGAVTGSGFSISGVSYPATLNPGQTATLTVQFDPTTAGAVTGAVTLTTNTSAGSASIALSGTGQSAVTLSGISCASSSMTGAGSDACTVSLTGAAPSGGLTVTLSSSSSAVTVPASVTVPAGATSVGFTASVSSVTTAQTATLTAQAGGVAKTYAISLGGTVPGLTLGSPSLSFGNVTLNSPTSQSVLLTSSGTAPLTISAGAVTGSGFSIAGLSYPATLNPGQTATLTVQFDPTTAGAVTGAVTLTTNTSAGSASIALSGTGQSAVTLSGISCASSSMTGAGSDACTVSLTGAAPSGGLTVTLSSSSSAVTVPSSVVVAAGATSVGFTAAVSSVTTAQTATLTAQSGGVTTNYAISLGAATPGLSGISCASGSMTGAGSDACTVSLTGAAPSGGVSVTLSSSSSAVTVPASVLVPAGASSVGFTATVSSVTTAQTATLTAQAGGVAKTYAISLGAGVPGLTLGSTKVAFGTVNLNTPATQSVLLTSSGTAPVTISAASVTGSGFAISGLALPLTLNPGQTATLNIQFDPTASGSVTGAVTVSTNASPSTATIALSGTGQTTSYQVDLTWSAPSSSSDPVAGYHVYRAANGAAYQLITSTLDISPAYTDSTVASGANYTYYVVSVDSAGNESAPSNSWAATIP